MESNIKQAVSNEIFRIICFIIYYIVLIAFGISLFIGAYWGSYYCVVEVLPLITSFRLLILLFIAILGCWAIAIMLGIYLIKPLFSFTRNQKETRVEVVPADCPALFDMIAEVAKLTGCAMPKHVYLSPDVNACVFYNTSFWNIFFPVRKNLEIGLGLFDGMSVDEVKSVLAHEFGHFSQNSMRVGSMVYIVNTVLHNLIYSKDFWDKWVDEWCMSDLGAFRIYGGLTRMLTWGIRHTTIGIFEFVQKGYLRLSRYMEYEADSISCECVGSRVFISALCKIEVLSKKDNLYRELISSLIDRKQIVENYFVGKKIMYNLLPYKDLPNFKDEDCLTEPEPVVKNKVKSKIKMEDAWASHPSLEDRIQNALLFSCDMPKDCQSLSAWSLIPKEVSDKVSMRFIGNIKSHLQETDIDEISEMNFAEWAEQEIHENYMDERLRPFFGHNFFLFDRDGVTPTNTENPFTNDNALKIAEFVVNIEDLQTFNQIKSGEIKVREIQYDGKMYKKNRLPIDALKAQVDELQKEVRKINSQIYFYVSSQCCTEQKIALDKAYNNISYALQFSEEGNLLPGLLSHRDGLFRELNRATHRDEDEYNKLRTWIIDYEQHLKSIISQLDMDSLSGIVDEGLIQQLKEYTTVEHHSHRRTIGTDNVNEMFYITDTINSIINHLYNYSKKVICDITQEVLDKKQ